MTGLRNNYMSIVEEEKYPVAGGKADQLIDILEKEGFKKSFLRHWSIKKYSKQGYVAEISSVSRMPWFGRKYTIISIDSEKEINPNDSLIQKIEKWAKGE